MSSISIDIPILQMDEFDIQNMVGFIFKHERLLKEFGAIKIQPTIDCKLSLKKRKKNLLISPINKQIVKSSKDNYIYNVKKVDQINKSATQKLLVEDEAGFWSSLSRMKKEQRQLNISLLPNKSFFAQKKIHSCFDRLPAQSLLKIGGKKLTQQFVPCVERAHGPGAIFPLSCTQQRLFSLNYHHEGGVHHWYIIPARERTALQAILDKEDLSICLDHGQVFINPSILDKNHIRYHRITQRPNEFVVLSAGTLTQVYTEGASWSESIAFALPSWIEDGHANISIPLCQCDIPYSYLLKPVDVNLFRPELIKRYMNSYLNTTIDDKSILLTSALLHFF
jgi:hypothetical protein